MGRQFMLDNMDDMINLVCGNPGPLERAEITGLTQMGLDAAREGDGIAREILLGGQP